MINEFITKKKFKRLKCTSTNKRVLVRNTCKLIGLTLSNLFQQRTFLFTLTLSNLLPNQIDYFKSIHMMNTGLNIITIWITI